MTVTTITEAPTIAPPVTRRDVLHRAADLLSEYGWCQHSYGNKEAGHFCLVGAISEAHRELTGTYQGGYAHAIESMWDGASSPAHWNDRPGRTKAEVVARLRDAAEATT